MIKVGMSERIISAIKEKRRARVAWILRITLLVVWISGSGLNFWASIKRQQAAKKKEWPTWAAFSTSGNVASFVVGRTEDGIPNIVTVNGEKWSIVKITTFKEDENIPVGTSFHGAYAKTFCANKVIVYIDHKSSLELRDSLMHEIFHAGACLHGGDTWWNSEKPNENDHPGVYHLGEFMTNFALANKEFMMWFEQG